MVFYKTLATLFSFFHNLVEWWSIDTKFCTCGWNNVSTKCDC